MSELRPIAPIKFSTPLKLSPLAGKPGELRLIPLPQLFIDPTYQRNILGAGGRNVRAIAESFDWSFFAPLIVAARGSKQYAVIDGQHRAIAAICRGDITALPCLMIKADYATQARAFSVINGQVTRLHRLQVFRAQVAAGDKAAKEIVAACDRAGVVIAPYPKPANVKKQNETLAIGSIEKVYRRFGPDVLTRSLALLLQSGTPEFMGRAPIRAVAQCLADAPEWCSKTTKQLLAALANPGLKALYKTATQGHGEKSGATQFTRVLTEKLEAAFGKRKVESPASKRSPAHGSAKAQKQKAEALAREQAVTRARQRPSAPPPPLKQAPTKSTEGLIAAHIAKHGVRKFESGATGDTGHLLDWLARECGKKTARLHIGSKGGRIYQVDGKAYDLNGVLAVVNVERKKRKLEPLNLGIAA